MVLFQNSDELINKVGERIQNLLEEKDFELSIKYLLYLHGYIFKDLLEFPNPDRVRKYNVSKEEKILNGDSVIYADYHNIMDYLNYDLNETKKYSFTNTSNTIKNIATLSARIWQVHPFTDGNTRTVNVFMKKYLDFLGYPNDNDIFKYNNTYYRNALVRANYYNHVLGVTSDMQYLELFYKKLLVDKEIVLDNDTLYLPNVPKVKTLQRNGYY